MYSFEDLQKANNSIKATPIKGKDYAEVNQRIKAFRSVCPHGAIITEMTSNENGVCVFRATVYDEEKQIIGTGTAYEKEGSSNINRTSYIENCETSAVGRALGMCGFGIDTSVASYEEVANAIENQNEQPEIICNGCGVVIKPIKKRDGSIWAVEDIKEYSERRFNNCLCWDCQKELINAEKEGAAK